MRRLIVISPLDCGFYDSNRAHHIVGQLRSCFDEVVLIHRRILVANAVSHGLRFAEFFRLRHEIKRDGNLARVAVTPLFARPDGMSLAVMQVADPYQPVASPRRRLTMRLLSLMGLLLDLFCVPSYLLAYLKHGAPKAEVTIAQGPWEFLAARILQMLGRTSRLVYDDWDYMPGNYTVSPLKRRIIAALENYSIGRADAVISVGELLAELRRRETGREVLVVPNGADIAQFALARNRRPHPPTLIYVGAVSAWAGVDLAIAALGRIRKEIPDARLLVVGHSTPDFLALLDGLCEAHGVREHVHFLGKRTQQEVVDFLAEADIGMAVFRPVELRKYAFSLKIIEYMAAGLPVITTVGTQSERVVVRHSAGLAVDYSTDAIATAALLLFKDTERYQSMAAHGIKASAGYSWETLILGHLYPALADGGEGSIVVAKVAATAEKKTPRAR